MNYIDSKRCLPHFSISRNDMFAVMNSRPPIPLLVLGGSPHSSCPIRTRRATHSPATTAKVSHQILKLMPYRNESQKAQEKSADLERFPQFTMPAVSIYIWSNDDSKLLPWPLPAATGRRFAHTVKYQSSGCRHRGQMYDGLWCLSHSHDRMLHVRT